MLSMARGPGRTCRRFAAAAAALLCAASLAGCAAAHSLAQYNDPLAQHDMPVPPSEAYKTLDVDAVRADLKKLMTDSKDFWPADFGHYGGLMIRLAWHCAGAYRQWDGRGGCDGARIRFPPELAWPDNTNLDKARRLLWDIKVKYGPKLSWGDLIVLAGDTAIKSMGGPIFGFCGGRIDDVDGTDSLELGPNQEQEAVAPCKQQGDCKEPLGPTTIGLIYVNPEGPMGNPVPEKSAPQIRDVFGRMGMDDKETVALIGGGHAFGKVHGACPSGAGPDPLQSPADSWPGTCGHGAMKGKGENTFTSGFEGSWVTTPTQWSNQYFKNLLEYQWEKFKGPGGRYQWRPKKITGKEEDVVMLTADVALLQDEQYLKYVKLFAHDLKELEDTFSRAWYKLMSRDMGPVTRCLGHDVPSAQSFQNPLPKSSGKQADFNAVRRDIEAALSKDSDAMKGDKAWGKTYYGALFTTLAWQCASTFRATDYQGGCNGARIRFAPQSKWAVNKIMGDVLNVLEPIQDKYRDSLSWADLVVLSGNVALEKAGGKAMKFCGGRVDAKDGGDTDMLKPREYGDAFTEVKDTWKVMGLTQREGVALAGRLRSHQQARALGYSGTWAGDTSDKLSNEFYKLLLRGNWEATKSDAGKEEYKAEIDGKTVYMMPTDLVLRWDATLVPIVQEYASDNDLFLRDFAAAWTKLMNADRFDGPDRNECDAASH